MKGLSKFYVLVLKQCGHCSFSFFLSLDPSKLPACYSACWAVSGNWPEKQHPGQSPGPSCSRSPGSGKIHNFVPGKCDIFSFSQHPCGRASRLPWPQWHISGVLFVLQLAFPPWCFIHTSHLSAHIAVTVPQGCLGDAFAGAGIQTKLSFFYAVLSRPWDLPSPCLERGGGEFLVSLSSSPWDAATGDGEIWARPTRIGVTGDPDLR